MLEAKGNLWDFKADAYIITTNGFVKKNGQCVMGRGCAKEARDKFPGIAKILGDLIQRKGNNVHQLYIGPIIFSFPVKHNWWEKADIGLIQKSTEQIANILDPWKDGKFVMPRPGCGNGQLTWEEVKPVIEPILDDRFTVVTF